MAYVETMTAVKGNLRLNIGTTATGLARLKNLSVGTLNPSTFDVDKFAAIALAISPMLENTLTELQDVKTYRVEQQG